MVGHTVYSRFDKQVPASLMRKKERTAQQAKVLAQGLTTRIILLAESRMVEGENWPPEVV